MYVCICNSVNDTAIKESVENGVRNFRDLSARTGCGTQCGSCIPLARRVLDEALHDAGRCGPEIKLAVATGI